LKQVESSLTSTLTSACFKSGCRHSACARVGRAAFRLRRSRCPDLLLPDAHRARSRRPRLTQRKKLGSEYLLCLRTPKRREPFSRNCTPTPISLHMPQGYSVAKFNRGFETSVYLLLSHTSVWLFDILHVNLRRWLEPNSSGIRRRIKKTKRSMESHSQKPNLLLLIHAA